MYNTLLGKTVTVVVASRGDKLLEYVGTLSAIDEETLQLRNAKISYLMLDFQASILGAGMNVYKDNVDTVILNRQHVVSCSN